MALRRAVSVVGVVALGFLLCLEVTDLAAAEVAGVKLPEQVVLEGGGGKLVLNGAGVRKKFVVKVYVGALYLPEKSGNVEKILGGPGGRRVVMHFLHKEVGAEKLVEGWNKGFAANLAKGELKAMEERIGLFNGLFRTAYSGDVYHLDLVPGKGTEVRLNGNVLGTIPGEDFYRALLKVWLGEKPGDKGLKKALLGK